MTSDAIGHSELRSAIGWYFESKNLAIKNALKLQCPLSSEQQKELRQYYSEYFVSLVSATDLLWEPSYEFNTKFKEQLSDAFAFDSFPNGETNYLYIRELRNSVVHRGLDICSAAHVYENFLFVVAPPEVSNRDGKKIFRAFGNYLIEVIAKCEQVIGPLIARHLEEVGFLRPLLTQDQAKAEALKFLSTAPAVPDWVKQNGLHLLSQVDFVQGQTSAIENLVSLLNFNALSAADAQPIIPPNAAR